MRKLKTSEIVFHKEYGQGIVIAPKLWESPKIQCRFETEMLDKNVHRWELYVKGDKVLAKYCQSSRGKALYDKKDARTFLGYAPWTLAHHFVVTTSFKKTRHTIKGYTYVYDIKHAPNPAPEQVGFDFHSSGRFCSRQPNIQEIPRECSDCRHLRDCTTLKCPCHIYESKTVCHLYPWQDKMKEDMLYKITAMEEDARLKQVRRLAEAKHVRRNVLRKSRISEAMIDRIIVDEFPSGQ